jgi:hypothetical protein
MLDKALAHALRASAAQSPGNPAGRPTRPVFYHRASSAIVNRPNRIAPPPRSIVTELSTLKPACFQVRMFTVWSLFESNNPQLLYRFNRNRGLHDADRAPRVI